MPYHVYIYTQSTIDISEINRPTNMFEISRFSDIELFLHRYQYTKLSFVKPLSYCLF